MVFNRKMFVTTYLVYLCLVVLPSIAQINLSTRKHTSQSSNLAPESNSSLAVDNCVDQLFECEEYCKNTYHKFCCTHQLTKQNFVWWSVDLEQQSEIAHIFVYFRKYESMLIDSFEVFRSQGYTIQISNNTDPKSGKICFEDKTYTLSNITRTRNHTSCTNITGRYVHFTNKGSVNNNNNALLELCEVQIYGCPVGTFGVNCATRCDSVCLQGRCNPYSGKCFACNEGKFRDNTGICRVCSGNCSYCINDTHCSKCSEKFYLFYTGNEHICQQCPSHCTRCENYVGCTQCYNNYYLKSKICQPCPAFCSSCTNENGCDMCEKGFALENNMCIKCEKNCLQCRYPKSCLECKTGYYLHANQCQSCPEYCIACDMEGHCKECLNGYYVSIERKCIKCLHTCSNCSLEGCTDIFGNTNESKMSLGTYIGAIVGSTVVIGLIAFFLLFLFRKKIGNKESRNHDNTYEETIVPRREIIYDELIGIQQREYNNVVLKENVNSNG